MASGVPYYEFLILYRQFLKEHRFESPSDLAREVRAAFRQRKLPMPSPSQFWQPFYGRATLSKPVLAYLFERYKFHAPSEALFPVKIEDAHRKSNKISVPGQRELKFKYIEEDVA